MQDTALTSLGLPLLIAAVLSAAFQFLKKKVGFIRALPDQGKQAVVVALAFIAIGILAKLGIQVDGSAVLTGLASMGIYTLYQPPRGT